MYRLIILLSLLHVVISHRDGSHHHSHRSHHQDHRLRHRDRTFENLAKQVINLDKKSKELCNDNCNNNTIEDYTSDDFKIIVKLPDYKEDQITVKLKYRVLFINAEKEVDSDTKVYFEVRVVPEVANIRNATWSYDDGQLEISFPYKERTEYATETCTLVIDESTKTVPRYAPDLDMRREPESTKVPAKGPESDQVNAV